MADLIALSRLDVTTPVQAFGQILILPETITWDLVATLGTPGAQVSGFTTDPSGLYLIQQSADSKKMAIDADETQWTTSGTGSYSHGTDDVTGKKFLMQTVSAASWTATSKLVRVDEEGLTFDLYRAAAPASDSGTSDISMFIELNYGRPAGTQGIGLNLVPGSPIRLQASDDDSASWYDVAVDTAWPDCESFLDQNDRHLLVDLTALTDPSWDAGLPLSLALSGPPAKMIVVSLGGGNSTLTYATPSFAGGSIRVTGGNGLWGMRLFKKRFQPTASYTLPPRAVARPLMTTPTARLQGYVPYADGLTVDIEPFDITGLPYAPTNQAYSILTLDATGDVDDTGYTIHTVALSKVTADFPEDYIPPTTAPIVVSYFPDYTEFHQTFTQETMTVRSRALMMFADNNNILAPGAGVYPAARAAQLLMGVGMLVDGQVVLLGDGMVPQLTGWTGIDEAGFTWEWRDRQKYFGLVLKDKLVKGDDNQTPCGFQLPYGGQCQYHALGQQLLRMGIQESFWNFPFVDRDQPTGYYYLPQGTNAAPTFQPHEELPLGAFIETIRAASCEFDLSTGLPQPMVYGADALGNIDFFGLPVGIVQMILNPNLTLGSLGILPQQVYQVQPQFNDDGTPAGNELRGLRVISGLSNIRTPVVLQGIDPFSGQAVFGVAYNELLGGGPYSDPNAYGYVGTDVPLYVSSRLFTSPFVAYIQAFLSQVATAFPAVAAEAFVHLQPNLFALTPVAITDYGTLGDTRPVPFYATDIVKIDNKLHPADPQEETRFRARYLGQPD